MSKRFVESEHKRDERGRFAEMETSELKERQTQDLDEEKEKQKAKSIKSLTKRIAEHQDKINNPQKYVKDWDSKSEQYKKGIVKYWEKEILNYENQIKKLEGK